jgi:hypothetical protein
MKKLTALLLIAATALLGACNKPGDNTSGAASGSSAPASASK